jgi:protoheme IX farnesyltransferase
MQSPAPSTTESLRSASAPVTLRALVELMKPSIAGLVMMTASCGALAAKGPLPVGRLLVALIATSLVVGAANALNMYAEVDADALMKRTARRPLPSGRLAPEVALGFALLLASVGLNVLGIAAGGLPCALTLLAFVSYVFVYTPLKRVTPHALTIGALPGALPPLIGYAAVEGRLAAPAWILFAILFVWQLPHFIAIAIFREADYRRAGMQVWSVARGAAASERAIALTSALLFALTLLPSALGMVHLGYLAVVLPVGLAFLALAVAGPRGAPRGRWARRVFFASMPYLVVVYAAFVAAV